MWDAGGAPQAAPLPTVPGHFRHDVVGAGPPPGDGLRWSG
ncbi:MAG: hypothetical protein AVDCRST_MAG19-944 [uncultured Thermomicrobiales bacterium]|uniref:Uncharacterized protein n=1 Tax=uncultured Thermomicrobiales bacterium TaxID=1645740 RepID=A0A6J4UKL5_9BACT|nr:MAG: hypothetical protein AVDCRST_MAG19-944 [uncultured Thermomicrobiales bacterium]